MANTNAPFGFRPGMHTRTGGSGAVIPTHQLVGYGTALFININDAVTHAAAGAQSSLAVDAAITPGTTAVAGRSAASLVWPTFLGRSTRTGRWE
jgi:hypothetical protein